jgi:hypothetical protein
MGPAGDVRTLDPEVCVSEQVMAYAVSCGRVTPNGTPDLSGLVLEQDWMTYRVRQRTVARTSTEWVPTGERHLVPPRWGGELRLDKWGARKYESRAASVDVIVHDLEVVDEAGNVLLRASFDESDGDHADGLEQFGAFLDHHGLPDPDEPVERLDPALYPWNDNGSTPLPRGPITRIAFGPIPAEPRQEATPKDAADDGGLTRARVDRSAERAARSEAAAALARRSAVHHEAVDAALAEQDERVGKAVRAFLSSARTVGGAAGHEVWRHEGSRDSEIACKYWMAAIVEENGQIVLRWHNSHCQSRNYPGIHLVQSAHISFQPRVTVERLVDRDDCSFTRGLGVMQGVLPFYASGEIGQPNYFYVLPLDCFHEHEQSQMPELIARTTDWFVGLLADYLDRNNA